MSMDDYLLSADAKALGVIEAKPEDYVRAV
jgi:hypothetical protein